MKKLKVINLFGGPGTGKSTGAAYIFSHLKMEGINCELVTEYAKDLVWQGSHHLLSDQNRLFSEQYHRLDRLKGKVEIAITDSPLLLSLICGRIHNTLKPGQTNMITSCVGEFDNENIFLIRVKKYNPIGRSESEADARMVDEMTRFLLGGLFNPQSTFEGTKEGYDQILDKIKKEL